MKKILTSEGVEVSQAPDEMLVEEADGLMGRWTDYRIDMNDEIHTALVTELTVRGRTTPALLAKAAELAHHRWVQANWTENGPLDF